ncbi:MAG: ABC transporter ATP-binding protein [Candidatus Paceibacterota bacterium]|nr:MAG: ABC transporter ATP-binding protein [Candidatus Paceibacterota bacterium]
MSSLIKTSGLTKIFNTDGVETRALFGIDLEVKRGEFLAIMGPSGSGKSTLLHILGFLDSFTTGEFYFDGKSVGGFMEDELAKLRNNQIGFIFQSFNLLARDSVFENVRLPLLYSEIPENQWNEIVEKSVESVGLSHRRDYPTAKLSGGEKQRVAIARALVCNPQIIFADEPTGNLDSKSGQLVMDIIQKLSTEDGRTVILVTHETYTSQYAERIITLKDGRLESDRRVEKRHIVGVGFKK